jgi:CheY-like chemotaxis protein/tetratricopeptide (TPR) repeat protein
MAIRLLIIEDTAETAKMLQTYLKRYGFETQWVPDGQQGVDLFAREPFDVVLTDMFMPKLDGLEVAKRIRTLPRGNQTGLAMMSGLFRTTDWKDQAAQKAAVDLFFDKPFVLSDVKNKLLALAEQYTGAASESVTTPQSRQASLGGESGSEDPLGNQGKSTGANPVLAAAVRKIAASTDDQNDEKEKPIPVDGPEVVPQKLIELTRSRASGVLSFENGSAHADVVLLSGILVDASDNLRENLLGQRLVRAGLLQRDDLTRIHQRMKEGGERFGEAVLALELCEVEVLLTQLDEQAKERIIRVVGWPEGEMTFEADEDLAKNRAVNVYNLFEGILTWFARQPDMTRISGWLKKNSFARLHRTLDYDDGLAAYRLLAPASPLPDQLKGDAKKVKEIIKGLNKASTSSAMSYALHLYGFWMAGMVTLGEPSDDERQVPLAMGDVFGESELLDKELITELRTEWLRVQGRNHYEMFNIPTNTPRLEVEAALEIYKTRFDPERLKAGNLGPAASIGREILGRILEAEATLLDDKKRSQYDQTLTQQSGFEAHQVQSEAELLFFEGKKHLEEGKSLEAHQAFAKAHELEKDDADYCAYAGWALFLAGGANSDKGRAAIHKARQMNPNAMRPIFFLGLVAMQDGKVELARDFLNEAARRVPDDADVYVALSGLPPAPKPQADEIFDPFS